MRQGCAPVMRLPHITSVAAEVSDWAIRRVAEDSFSDRETFFPGWGFSERMRRSVLLLELPLILAGLVFVEFGAVLHELRTDVVLDWFVTLAPLIWINASVLVVYSFLRLYRDPNLVPARPETSTIRGQGFLLPNFRAIREGGSALRRSWTAAMIVYALAFAFLQGVLVIDPSGSIEPVSTVLASPVGYGPGFVWAPTTTFGVVVRPFSVATALALSLLSGATFLVLKTSGATAEVSLVMVRRFSGVRPARLAATWLPRCGPGCRRGTWGSAWPPRDLRRAQGHRCGVGVFADARDLDRAPDLHVAAPVDRPLAPLPHVGWAFWSGPASLA